MIVVEAKLTGIIKFSRRDVIDQVGNGAFATKYSPPTIV